MSDTKLHCRNVSPEVEQLAAEVGEFIKYWGFKRVHGKIWTHLFLANDPRSAKDIMRSLRISKGLVSMSINDLLEYEMIVHVSSAPDGTRLFLANSDINEVIRNVLKHRELKMMERIANCHQLVESLNPAEKERFGLSDRKIEFFGDLVHRLASRFGGICEIFRGKAI